MISCLPRMRALLVLSVLPLAACNETTTPPPPEHSGNYTRIPVVTSKGRLKKVTVAEACMRADETDPQLLGPNLPPGCANAHNLQVMAEKERDLYRGRRMGAADAGPSARAAREYLYKDEEPALGGAVRDGDENAPGAIPATDAPGAQK